ncbi:beta/gamma crystallin-related protein [Corallococcus macrosporus]|uniref:Development-specific protein S n=1 Tax=Corallococcus macrosporus DSM 14697 TaxID=1189310 RepID=A0A250K2L5_9BACT|nr:beta/gamma crystallin-related protein [Corallococcus macrosporus]ATB50349.1 development-specific protein S [Corallococcus macrosporus DSM 14697]
MANITVFYNEDFGGTHVDLPPGNYTRAQLEARGIGNNTISSVKVPPGVKAVLFKDDNFAGDQLEVVANAESLGALNNNTSSIRVISVPVQPRARLFYKANFEGKEVDLPPGQYLQAQLELYGIDNNTISSVRPEGLTVVLYKNDNFSGTTLTVTSNTSNLGALDNNTSSIRIT